MNAPASGVLEREQQSLLLALVGDCNDHDLWPMLVNGAPTPLLRRGLQAYQANGVMLGERVLAAAYPVLAQLIGETSFAPLARHFWRQQPPQRGDLACWGAGLADFLEAETQLASEPFLGDVARIEWALHLATGAADVKADLPSLALLSGDDEGGVTLALAAGTSVMASAYPVASITNAHLHGEPTLADAAACLHAGRGEFALVWRQGFRPRLMSVSAAEYMLIRGLLDGWSLEAALEKACAEDMPAFNFGDWLALSAHNGLVTGANFLQNNKEKTS